MKRGQKVRRKGGEKRRGSKGVRGLLIAGFVARKKPYKTLQNFRLKTLNWSVRNDKKCKGNIGECWGCSKIESAGC